MQGNSRKTYGTRCKLTRECWGMQENAGEYQGNIRQWVQSARGMQGNAGECIGMQRNGGDCQANVREWLQSARGMQENAGECRRMPGERMGVGAMCQGNAGECQGNVLE